jgi:hypothetical protein
MIILNGWRKKENNLKVGTYYLMNLKNLMGFMKNALIESGFQRKIAEKIIKSKKKGAYKKKSKFENSLG